MKINLLTNWSFFSTILESRIRDARSNKIYLDNINYYLLDITQSELVNMALKDGYGRILTRITGQIRGVKEFHDAIVKDGFAIDQNGKMILPDLSLGFSRKAHQYIFENKHGLWISAEEEEKLNEHLKIHTKINTVDWLKRVLANSKNIKTIHIEDPYILRIEEETLVDITKKIGEFNLANLTLVYAIKYGSSDYVRDLEKLDLWKRSITAQTGIEPVCTKKKFHDRVVIINGMIFLLGHSFTMRDYVSTYAIGMDMFTYERNKVL